MQDRVRHILQDLEAVRENLLALSDDIWMSIDPNEPEGLEAGVQFKRAYNEKMAAFDTLASELSAMVRQFTAVRLESEEQTGAENESENVRIVQELNHEEPHSIDEGFTHKRPHGLIFDGQATTGSCWPCSRSRRTASNCSSAGIGTPVGDDTRPRIAFVRDNR